ncbi:hypothetical protein PMAYCL1PPCAC_05774, partial [Pristionchus mayeri]
MDSILDRLGSVFPFLHSAIFIIGFTSNVTLLTAAFRKTPKTLKTYSIMIKFGTLNDLVCVCCDFFVMQRLWILYRMPPKNITVFVLMIIAFLPPAITGILTKLWKFSSEMSVRTRKMHGNLVKALTIHATLPPITIIGVILYLVLFFDLYYHATLEKAIYTFAALPPALSAFCTLYYVEPYRRFISGRSARVSFSTINVSVTYS